MNRPKNAEQRLEVSRALCLQALKQPLWLLAAQRASIQLKDTHSDTDGQNEISALLEHCVASFLHKFNVPHVRQSQTGPAQQHGPG